MRDRNGIWDGCFFDSQNMETNSDFREQAFVNQTTDSKITNNPSILDHPRSVRSSR